MSVGIAEVVLVIVVIVILVCPDKLPTLIASTKKVAANVTDASNKVRADITEAIRDSDVTEAIRDSDVTEEREK